MVLALSDRGLGDGLDSPLLDNLGSAVELLKSHRAWVIGMSMWSCVGFIPALARA